MAAAVVLSSPQYVQRLRRRFNTEHKQMQLGMDGNGSMCSNLFPRYAISFGKDRKQNSLKHLLTNALKIFGKLQNIQDKLLKKHLMFVTQLNGDPGPKEDEIQLSPLAC